MDANDPDHAPCADLLVNARDDLIVPSLVLAEVDYWCHARLTGDVWLAFLDDVLAGVYRHEPPTESDLARCADLQTQYADLRLGVVDASLVALSERLGETTIATLDRRHFGVVRPRHTATLTLLP